MHKQDILIKMDGGLFSYRVAGVLIQNGMVLLQHVVNETVFALPGGHVNFGEASADALVREYKEETGADIVPVRLLWVAENFFPWGTDRCHQICFNYLVALRDENQIPLNGSFLLPDERERKISNLEFCWFPISALDTFKVYPVDAKERLLNLADHIEHVVYSQE